jgi:GTP-binding protein HflX
MDASLPLIRATGNVLLARLDPADGAGLSWLYRHTKVLARKLGKEGKLIRRVRVDPDKVAIVRTKFGA